MAQGGLDLLQVGELELPQGGDLRDRASVLHGVGVGVVGTASETRHEAERLGGPRRACPSLGDRAVRVVQHRGVHVRRGSQAPVELGESREQRRPAGADVLLDPPEQLRARVVDVVARVAELGPVTAVVGAHPLEEGQVLLGVPQAGAALELLAHDLPDVALAGDHVVVDAQAGGRVHLLAEGAEAALLDQVAEDPVLRGEELVGVVRGLAEPGDHRVAPPSRRTPGGRRGCRAVRSSAAAGRGGRGRPPLRPSPSPSPLPPWGRCGSRPRWRLPTRPPCRGTSAASSWSCPRRGCIDARQRGMDGALVLASGPGSGQPHRRAPPSLDGMEVDELLRRFVRWPVAM